jgi:putative membrane protein
MLRIMVIRWFINTIALGAASVMISGIYYYELEDLIIAAALFGLLNTFIKPVLLILTLPINLLSLGLFTFVINAIMLGLTGSFLSGFIVSGFWAALGGAIIVSIISIILNSVFKEDRPGNY